MAMKHSSRHLRVLVTNAFGLTSKFGEFCHVLKNNQPDVAIVTETKFTREKMPVATATVTGYHEPLRLDRTSHGGGIAVWIRQDLAFKQLDHLATNNHEMVWFCLTLSSGEKVVFCALYRPGSCSDSDVQLLEYLDRNLDCARRSGKHIILAGDFNVHNHSWLGSSKTTRAGEFAEDMCILHGLYQHVPEPTRGQNTLDLVLSDIEQGVRTTLLPPLAMSDHVVLISEFNLRTYREPKSSRLVWRYHKADWPRLRYFFSSADWQSVFSESADESCTGVTQSILKGMKQFIPSKTLNCSPNDPCWWTPECSAAIRNKEKTWKRLRKSPTDANNTIYRSAVKNARNQLRQSRLAHLDGLRQRLRRGNMPDKQWWGTVKQVGGEGRGNTIPVLTSPDGSECVTNQEKADCIAKFFASKCSLEADLTDDSMPEVNYSVSSQLCRIRFRPSTVERALKQLDGNKATGPDSIPARVLKACATELASPLAQLFSLCFSTGVQPTLWKTARVVPLHKRKSKSVPSNYRPVSLLCILSKVMESIINRQIVNFLEANHVLSSHQFGFRRGLGTADLLTRLQHEWSSTLALKGEVHVVAADIAGAFDKVSHKGVLHKARNYGLSGPLLCWLSSYLSDRRLQVVIGGQESALQPVQAGVPQGSILGPTLFLLYVNDCEHHLPPGVKLAVYADDTTLYKCVTSNDAVQQCGQDLQSAIHALADWGRSWKIQFEPTKSQAMSLSHHRPPWHHPRLVFDGVQIAEERSMKLLGVTFDQQLTFCSHIRNVALRAKQRLYFLRRVAPLLDAQSRAKVYNGFVRPVLEYCPLVWMGASPTALAQLEDVQRRALRVIDYGAWLPSLAVRRAVGALCFIFKLLCMPPESPLKSLVPELAAPPISRHSTRRQSSGMKHNYQLASDVPFTARNSILRAFPSGILDTWNSLPVDILPDKPDFKRLQTFKANAYHHLRRTNWEWATTRL